jgi:hypothetical protein
MCFKQSDRDCVRRGSKEVINEVHEGAKSPTVNNLFLNKKANNSFYPN